MLESILPLLLSHHVDYGVDPDGGPVDGVGDGVECGVGVAAVHLGLVGWGQPHRLHNEPWQVGDEEDEQDGDQHVHELLEEWFCVKT